MFLPCIYNISLSFLLWSDLLNIALCTCMNGVIHVHIYKYYRKYYQQKRSLKIKSPPPRNYVLKQIKDNFVCISYLSNGLNKYFECFTPF